MSTATHNARILAALKRGERITAAQALKRFGCMRLAARIFELKEAGNAIDKSMVEVETRDGLTRVAEYRLVTRS